MYSDTSCDVTEAGTKLTNLLNKCSPASVDASPRYSSDVIEAGTQLILLSKQVSVDELTRDRVPTVPHQGIIYNYL